MRGLHVTGLGALVVGVTTGGCGDGPLCPAAVFVAVQTAEIARDVDATTPGVQADITVRTSVAAGEQVTLEVRDRDGVLVHARAGVVDDAGLATFAAVTVAEPRTFLRASVETACGADANEVGVDVLASSACALSLMPAPAPNAHYAPLAVLTTVHDPDPQAAGFQLAATVASRPGWRVELAQSTATGDQVLATAVADRDGTARIPPQPLVDGVAVLRATCRDPAGTLAVGSLATAVLVDTTPPTCAFTRPYAGSTITPRYDANHDLGDGVQLALAAEVRGADVEGEPAQVAYRETAGGTPVDAPTTAVDATGAMTAIASLAPATTPARFTFGLAARDHAGNACTIEDSFDVDYAACDLAVVTPAGYATRDVGGAAGSQVDVTLAASAACVGRAVTGTCGLAPVTGTVRADGTLTMRTTVCTTAPCEIEAPCSFEVATAGGVPTRTVTRLAFDSQPPVVSVELTSPALPCGASVTAASDGDPAMPGVQIGARVAATGAITRNLELSNAAGASTVVVDDAAHAVTLVAGLNRLTGIAYDAAGNRGRSLACSVRLVN